MAQSKAIETQQPARGRETEELSYHAKRETSERHAWESLRPSLAVAFSSRASAEWRPELLPDTVRAEILAGLEARAAIRRRYSELDSAVFDVLHSLTRRLECRSSKRREGGGLLAKVRCLGSALTVSGRPSEHNRFLDAFGRQLGALADDLPLLVHGLVEVREDKGNVTFRFELLGSKRTWRESQLSDFASMLEKLTEAARDRLRVFSVTV